MRMRASHVHGTVCLTIPAEYQDSFEKGQVVGVHVKQGIVHGKVVYTNGKKMITLPSFAKRLVTHGETLEVICSLRAGGQYS